MTAHLPDDALLEIAEAGTSHPHLAECDRCRRTFEQARDALMAARADRVPEPSPLFWERFSARVREEIGKERIAPERPVVGWRIWAGAAAAAAVLVLLVASNGWRLWPPGGDVGPRAAGNATTIAAPATEPAAPADAQSAADLSLPATDPSWLVIEQVTAHVQPAGVADAGLVLQPDATERALAQLSPAEQQELIRLLRSDPDGQ